MARRRFAQWSDCIKLFRGSRERLIEARLTAIGSVSVDDPALGSFVDC
jgi:hypothetical protein